MTNKNVLVGLIAIIAIVVAGYFLYFRMQFKNQKNIDSMPQNMTLSGTYVCLPHLDTSGPQTDECAFGLKTDDGIYYAVNFGQSADSMTQFQSRTHIKAEGFMVIKEALSTDQWQKYNMKGIFTITKTLEPTPVPPVQAKININVVCEGALAYMTFSDAKSANVFVTECKEGKHPEVIEQYIKQLNLPSGVAI